MQRERGVGPNEFTARGCPTLSRGAFRPCEKRMSGAARLSRPQSLEITVPGVKAFGMIERASEHRTHQDEKHIQGQV